MAALLCILSLCFGLMAPVESAAAPRKSKKEKRLQKEDRKSSQQKDKKDGKKKKTAGKAEDEEDEEEGDKKLKDARAEAETAQEQKEKKPRIVPDELKVPYLSIYYLQPVLPEGSKQTVRFYVTDWDQSEYRKLEFDRKFNVRIAYWPKNAKNAKQPKEIRLDAIPAGDHAAETEALPAGEYRLELSAEDEKGRRSPVLYHEFWVQTPEESTISEDQTHRMTENDLNKYDIQNKGDYGVFGFRKLGDPQPLEEFREELNKKMPKNGYSVIVYARKLKIPEKALGPDKPGAFAAPMPEWIPDLRTCRESEINYGPAYNEKAMEAEAVRTGKGLNQLMTDMRQKGKRKVVLLPGCYRISHTTPLEIPSGLTLDLNGATIKLNRFTGCGAIQVRIRDGFDSHLVNGIVEGDYFEHDYEGSEKNSEWVSGIGIDGESKYCSMENVLVRYITGYGVTNGFHGVYGSQDVGKLKRGTIDRKTGKHIPADALAVTGFLGIGKFVEKTPYLTVSRFLGYQGIGTDEWNILYHFYDSAKNYLTTIDGWQYRRVLIPPKAAFMRVTVYAETIPETSPLTVNFFRIPWNSWYKNLFITNARCVGMAPAAMYNFKIENCTFMRSGESGSFCAFDAEDGWDMMQDVWIVRNFFSGNARNDLLTCGGHNFVIEGNSGKIHLWNGTHGYVARKNKFGDAFFGSSARRRSLLVRVSDNVFEGSLNFAESMTDDGWTIAIHGAPYNIKCGTGGVVVGGKYRELTSRSVNLLGAELNNCELDFFGARLTKCKINGLRGGFGGKVFLKDCEINDADIQMAQVSEMKIDKCRLKNTTFTYKYNVAQSSLQMKSSTVTDLKKPFISIPSATLGEFKFTNCRLNTGAQPLCFITHWDTREKPASFELDSCTVENDTEFVVDRIKLEEDDTVSPISFTAVNSRMNGSFVKKPPRQWAVDSRAPGDGCSLKE